MPTPCCEGEGRVECVERGWRQVNTTPSFVTAWVSNRCTKIEFWVLEFGIFLFVLLHQNGCDICVIYIRFVSWFLVICAYVLC